MDCFELSSESPYELLLKVASLIPTSHYLMAFLFLLSVFLHHFLEIHFLQDLFTGFRGQPVSFTFNSCNSDLYQEVLSKCKILHGRFLSTPWLSSPHLQTVFLQLHGSPVCNYQREIFEAADGGTIALDWLRNEEVKNPSREGGVQSDDKSPIMVVVTGLSSDSNAAYIKHLAFKMAHRGWNVVVINYRGLGGVSITSDCFFNSQWTKDVGEVIDHLHAEYPQAPLFAVGTSVGANVLVGYLGKEAVNTALVGAAAICCPWDILLCDRFLHRRPMQRLYNRALGIGLSYYAQLHRSVFSRLTDWETVAKSRSIRDFDNHATCVLGKIETVDTYYRDSCSASYLRNVTVPLLCISALDDPVCTREAIPWDECRANQNVVLATTQHGGHLAYFEGMTAKNLWWISAVDEFLCTLHSSPLIHQEKIQNTIVDALKSSMDQSFPYHANTNIEDSLVIKQNEKLTEESIRCDNGKTQQETNANPDFNSLIGPVKTCLNQLSRRSMVSLWVFAIAAIIAKWPILGSALPLFFKKKLTKFFSPSSLKR